VLKGGDDIGLGLTNCRPSHPIAMCEAKNAGSARVRDPRALIPFHLTNAVGRWRSRIPGGMAWDCRVVLNPKPTTSRLSQGGWPGIIELYSTRSRLQVGSPRGDGLGLSSCTRPEADYKSALPGGDRLGLSSCTRPEADYKSALPGGDRLGLSSCTRPEADYKSALPGGISKGLTAEGL